MHSPRLSSFAAACLLLIAGFQNPIVGGQAPPASGLFIDAPAADGRASRATALRERFVELQLDFSTRVARSGTRRAGAIAGWC